MVLLLFRLTRQMRAGDLGIIQDMARNAKFPVPVAAAALQMFLMASAAGMGRDDDIAVAKMYAQITGAPLPGGQK